MNKYPQSPLPLDAIKKAQYHGELMTTTKRKRWDMMVCEHCRKHRRLCPVCAGVI